MGRPALISDCHDLERTTHERNAICSRSLLDALISNHSERPAVAPESIAEPEPAPPPQAPLPPIPNAAIAEAIAIAFPTWVNAIKRIQSAVCKEYSVSLADLYSQRRHRNVVRPRQIAMYLCKTLTDRSYPEIGRRFGGRDHTTAIAAVRRVELLCAADDAFRGRVEKVAGLIA